MNRSHPGARLPVNNLIQEHQMSYDTDKQFLDHLSPLSDTSDMSVSGQAEKGRRERELYGFNQPPQANETCWQYLARRDGNA